MQVDKIRYTGTCRPSRTGALGEWASVFLRKLSERFSDQSYLREFHMLRRISLEINLVPCQLQVALKDQMQKSKHHDSFQTLPAERMNLYIAISRLTMKISFFHYVVSLMFNIQ